MAREGEVVRFGIRENRIGFGNAGAVRADNFARAMPFVLHDRDDRNAHFFFFQKLCFRLLLFFCKFLFFFLFFFIQFFLFLLLLLFNLISFFL